MKTLQNSILRTLALSLVCLGVAGRLAAAEATVSGGAAKAGETQRLAARKSTYPFRGEVAAVEGKAIMVAKKSGTRPIEVGADSPPPKPPSRVGPPKRVRPNGSRPANPPIPSGAR